MAYDVFESCCASSGFVGSTLLSELGSGNRPLGTGKAATLAAMKPANE